MTMARRVALGALLLVTLAVAVWGLRAQTRVAMLPPRSWEGPYPAVLRGTTVSSPEELAFRAQALRPGTVAPITSGSIVSAVAPRAAHPWPQLAVASLAVALFWAVAAFVFSVRLHLPAARILFAASLLYAIAIGTGGVFAPAGTGWADLLPPLGRIAVMPVLPFLFVHLVLVFPRRHAVLDRAPWLVPALYVAGAAVALLHGSAFLRYLGAPGAPSWGALREAERGATAILLLCELVGVTMLYLGSRHLSLARERRQAKWLLWGISIGVVPYALGIALPRALGAAELLPLSVARVATLAIPIAFSIAVVRERFLDIDVIIRRSVIYSLLAMILTGVYLVLALVVGDAVRRLVPGRPEFVWIPATAIPLLLFGPTRRAIADIVDRTLFQIRYRHSRAVDTFESLVESATARDAVARELERSIRLRLAPTIVSVRIERGRDLRDLGIVTGTAPAPPARDVIGAEAAGGTVSVPGSTDLPESERPDLDSAIVERGFRLAVPIHGSHGLEGVALVGEKENGWKFVEADLDLLVRLAQPAGVALERLGLLERVAAETAAREQAAALDRLKEDFFARVAHDLRTPLSVVSWTARNLLDGIDGPVTERQRESLRSVVQASRQLDRLVQNLLDVARLRRPEGPPLQFESVSLAAVADEAVSGIRPLLLPRGLRLNRADAGSLPPIRGDRNRLVEIVTNLLENAIKYSPDGGAIDVSVEAGVSGSQRLTVRDQGPGIPPGDRERIFTQFGQGPPPPGAAAGGLGLGLYVVREYLGLMGGTVAVDDHPDGGARFVCTLPAGVRTDGEGVA